MNSGLIMEAEARSGALRHRLAAQRLRAGELFVYGVQRHVRTGGGDVLVAREIARVTGADAVCTIAGIGLALGVPRRLIATARTRLRAALREAV